MQLIELLKDLFNDFVRYRWRDLVALGLMGMGLWILTHSQDPGARDEAKAIIGAALIMLDPRGMLPGASSNGNGHAPPGSTSGGHGESVGGAPPAPELPTSAKTGSAPGSPAVALSMSAKADALAGWGGRS